jgi:UDP-N-acetyl-D-glucosamine dehydrogenase
MIQEVSISPDGIEYSLPFEDDYENEYSRVKALATAAKSNGQEIVVVMGVGFVGAVMAAIVADTVNGAGKSSKFVIGVQRPSVRSFWKIPTLNKGICPVKSEDPEVSTIIRRCVLEKKTLTTTYTYDVLSLADVVIVDVQLDYIKKEMGNVRSGHVEMTSLEECFEIVAQHISPETLVLIETTIAPGTTEQIAFPLMRKIFRKRGIETDPLLAHSYERVMPGKNYVASVRDFWRVCSGVNKAATERVVRFLNEVLNTKEYPLTILDRPIESETAKIIENSFRATILAFMDEWSKFAERNGIDIVKVIDAVRVRPTHSNLLFPGPGIGGYCLPKDGGLGIWSYRYVLGFEDELFKMTPLAIDINDSRSMHASQFVRDALRNMNLPIAGAEILILGASYREDVGDTRYSGSEIIVRRLTDMGAEIRVHDPYVDQWWEFVSQDDYPRHGLKDFFRNQKKLRDLKVHKELPEALKGIDALIFAVRHKDYLNLEPEKVIDMIGNPVAVIDCFGVLDDRKIKKYLQLGCEVKGLGRGHIRRMKEEIRKNN